MHTAHRYFNCIHFSQDNGCVHFGLPLWVLWYSGQLHGTKRNSREESCKKDAHGVLGKSTKVWPYKYREKAYSIEKANSIGRRPTI